MILKNHKGVVTAVTAKSLLISEGTGKDDNIVIWLNAAHEYQVGQYLKVTGTLVVEMVIINLMPLQKL